MPVRADSMNDASSPAPRKMIVAACVLLGILIVAGLSLYRDYGISWDEPVQREYGEKVYRYIADGDDSLLADRHRVYGPAFELLLYSLEEGLGIEDLRDVYFMRHLVTFLMFAAGVVFFYLLAARVLKDRRMGILGAALFVLAPRIFAHAFYNSKDIPFMAMFTVCMYTLILYLDRKKAWVALVHGACCAILVDIRIMGVFVPVITLGFFARGMIAGEDGGEYAGEHATGRAGGRGGVRAGRGTGRTAVNLAMFCGAFVPLAILFWPTLWTSPVRNFLSAFAAMRKFAWGATVLFMGEKIRSTELPPHYTAVWILITLPLSYIALGAAGFLAALRKLAGRDIGLAVSGRDALLVLIWLVVPLVFLVASGAVLYDTWRHTFFVYPAILLLALMGLGWLLRTVKVRAVALALVLLVAANVVGAVSFMVRSHPHQNVYFNSIVGGTKGAEGSYEMDYWGLSYRRLLEGVLEKDGRGAIRIHSLNEPGYYNSFLLEPGARARITYVDRLTGADYYVTNFRWERMTPPAEAEFTSVKIDDAKLSAAYRLR